MAQRSLLLPAMAVAAVLGAVVTAVVVAGSGDTPTSAAAPPAVTVTVPSASTGGAAATAGDQGGVTDQGDQNGQGDQGDGSFVTVPSLVGMRLDDATAALSDASLGRHVDGGGLFGVLDDTAWTVCATTPDAGTEVAAGEVVVVQVDRSC